MLKRWSKNGATIYYQMIRNADHNLFALDVASHQVTQVTRLNSSQSPQSYVQDINLSPDDKQVVYIDSPDGQSDVWVMPLDGGPAVRVTNDPEEDRQPIWHTDGKRIIYTSVRAGIYQICEAYLDGRPPQQLTSGEGNRFIADVSADGTKLLYLGSKEDSDIWRVKIDTGKEDEMTADPGSELWPDVAPDGKTIAYQFIREAGKGDNLLSGAILTTSVEGKGQRLQLT
jgi:Tol biopolymer transport system component